VDVTVRRVMAQRAISFLIVIILPLGVMVSRWWQIGVLELIGVGCVGMMVVAERRKWQAERGPTVAPRRLGVCALLMYESETVTVRDRAELIDGRWARTDPRLAARPDNSCCNVPLRCNTQVNGNGNSTINANECMGYVAQCSLITLRGM
jgi:hypothetical protein